MVGAVGIVVLSYGSGGEHGPLLESLFEEGVPPGAIVLVHNPSEPGQSPPAAVGCEVVQASHNLGYAGGMNLGICHQLGRGVEFVLLVTHDARLRSGTLAALVGAARREPRYGALGPALVLGDTGLPFSYGGTTGSNGSVTHVRERPATGPGEVVPRDWIDGGAMLLRAETLALIGGFEERFWGYGEDADLCLRVHRAGYCVGVVVDAVAEQAPGGSKRLGAWSYLLTRNGLEYARRAVGMRATLGLGRQILVHAGIGFVRTVARGVRLRSGDPAVPWTESTAALRGIADFVLRRWGPPPRLRGMGDVSNTRPAAPPAEDERSRVLHMGPDAAIGGGMASALRALLASPLADRYRLSAVPTYRGQQPLRRLGIYCVSLGHLFIWRLRGRGRIVHVHATVRGSMYRKSVLVLLAKALGMRVVLQLHSGPGDVEVFAGGLGRGSLLLFRVVLRAADAPLAVSRASADAIERGYGVSGVAVVPNAAPRMASPDRRGRATTRVLYLGGFANSAKGGDVLVTALRLLDSPDVIVVLAGPGEIPASGRELLNGRTTIEWRGWLGEEELVAALEEADVFVLPSRSEGLPMALLEAMASGLAIVATTVGGVPEVLESERDALLVPPGDPPGLARALSRLAASSDLRARLGSGARDRAGELDASYVADRLDAIYAELR